MSVFQKIIVSLACFFSVAAQIELTLENNRGLSLNSVALGMPFSATVTVSGDEDIHAWPQIEGLQKFHMLRQHSAMNVVAQNGKHTQERRFVYTVIPDTAGTFTVGPVRINGKEQEETTKTITVLDAQLTSKERYPAPTFQLLLAKKSAVVGERVPFVLRFTYQDPEVQLTHIDFPNVPGMRIGQHDQGSASAIISQGEVYQTIEYKGFLYPELQQDSQTKKTVTFPPLRADYAERTQEAAWVPFFGMGMQRKAINSQPVTLQIEPLPASALPPQAVGTFSSFLAHLQARQAPQGEAVLFTLSLTGDADLEKIRAPQLALPDELRSYESKSTVHEQTKKWEYVMQGLKEGAYTIKEQVFTYFDPVVRAIKQLKTKPLTITITKAVNTGMQLSSKQQEEPHTQSSEVPAKKIAPVRTAYPVIPWSVFVLLLVLPALVKALLLVSARYRVVESVKTALHKRRIIRQARYTLDKACSEHNASQVYACMREACCVYYDLSEKECTDSLMRSTLLQAGWDEPEISEWESFLHEALRFSEYAPSVTNNGKHSAAASDTQIQELCKQANNWLIRLQKGGKS